jgi:hypothetical protein
MSTRFSKRVSRRKRLQQGLAVALVAVGLFGQLAAYAHLAFTRHVTCADHGELVDAGAEPESLQRDPQATATTAETVVGAQASAAHGHDHCLLAPVRRDRGALTLPAAELLAVLARTDDLVAPRAIVPAPAIALLRLAPKSSPPVRS